MDRFAYKYNREKFLFCFLSGGKVNESDGVFVDMLNKFFGDKPFDYDGLIARVKKLCDNENEFESCVKEINKSWKNCIRNKIIEKIGIFKSEK